MSSVDGVIGLLTALAETTLAGSAAVVLVLLLRRPLRQRFGAGAGYALWALVPVAMLAVLLPAATVAVPEPARVAALVLQARDLPAVPQPARLPWPALTFALWLSGAVATLAVLLLQQRRFVRALGRLQPREDGLRQAESIAGLPAAIGLLRPTVVVPRDFDSRYSAQEQALMREHERQHIVRGDLQCNAVVALLRCLYWFNPLMHHAARHYRHDQELACDARVIRRHPRARRVYGEAMLKTLLASRPAPLGCHWGYSHPLKERIEMLKQSQVSTKRWLAGAALVTLLAAATGAMAWTAQPKRAVAAAAGHAWIELEVRVDDSDTSRFRVHERYGEDFAISGHDAGTPWSLRGRVTLSGNGLMLLQTTLQRSGAVIGRPSLKVRDGEQARITIGSVRGSSDAQMLDGFDLKITIKGDAAPRAVATSAARPAAASKPTPKPMPAVAPGTAPAPMPAVAPSTSPMPMPAARAMPTVMAVPATPVADRDVAAYRALSPPPYPKGRKVQGVVLLDVLVGSDGSAEQVKLARSSGDAELDSSTVEAARKWRFEPAVRGGKALASWVRVPVEFARDAGAVADDAVELKLTSAGAAGATGAATLDLIRVGQQ